MEQVWFDELSELIRIPSVSADSARAGDVLAAATWVRDFVRKAGGEAELVETGAAAPLVIGEIRASSGAADAPTVLLYGHFDVQPPAPLDLWDSPPFELTVSGEWLVARGVADDKGQLWCMLKAAQLLAESGDLPVNLRVCSDGEEEIGGHSIVDFLADDERGADAAVIFDSGMTKRGIPEFSIATRGLVYFHVRVHTGERDLHSGLYGGAALNATHALMQTLAGVVPRDGRLPEPLRAGVAEPTEQELADWATLVPGVDLLIDQGARPSDPEAARDFYIRTWAEPAVDVNGVKGGSPQLQKTVLPVLAEANLSIRLAPGQDPDVIAPEVERLLREAAPPVAVVEVERWSDARPGLIPADAPAVRIAQDSFEEVFGVRPLLVRSGGTLPIVPALSDKGIPTIITGIALIESNVHSPNERVLLDYMPKGVDAARACFRAFAALR
ncbi:MAG TPA: M20/M25/M40 family metallo-hydrolase [Gaiellaceae bacterium]|nr:M20/M25/M40 family metallo-hydrolase [Gaiellaceae bacterium]